MKERNTGICLSQDDSFFSPDVFYQQRGLFWSTSFPRKCRQIYISDTSATDKKLPITQQEER